MSAGDFGGGVIDPRLLASLGPLLGTLNTGNAGDAAQQQLMQAMAQRTQQASEAAQRAGQAYGAAAAAPPPQVAPGDVGVPRLLGNIASVISRNPQYAQQGEQTAVQAHQDLIQNRIQNLANLRDIYDRQATYAAQAGNMEQAEKARMQEQKVLVEQQRMALLAHLDIAHGQQETQRQIAGIKATAQEQVGAGHDIARIKDALIKMGILPPEGGGTGGGTTPTSPYDKAIETTLSGRQYMNVANLSGGLKTGASAEALKRGLPIFGPNEISQSRDIDSSRETLNAMQKKLEGLLPSDWQQRIAQTPGIKLSQLLQTNAQRAAFNAFQLSATRDLRAIAGSKGLRMSEPMIRRTIQNDLPSLTDTHDVALERFGNLRTMLDTAEDPLFRSSATPAGPRDRALGAMDAATLRQILQQNPELDSDPQVIAKARSLRGK